MMRFKAVGTLAVAATCAVALTSCAGEEPAAEAGDLFGTEIISTADANGNSDTWVTWDPDSCAFVDAEAPADDWQPETRKPNGSFVVGFGAQDTTNEVNITMNKSMTDAAAAAGVELAFGDYKFPSTSDPVSVARTLTVREPAVIVSNNQLDDVLGSVNDIYAKACLPVVQVVTEAEGTVLFGPSNSAMGELEGQRLVEYATAQGWTAEDTTLITTLYSPAGPEVAKRATVCADTVKKAFPGIESVETDTTSTTSLELQNNFTDVLTAHPDAEHILNCTVADLWALANANSLKLAGREADAAVTGVNGGTAVLDAIEAGGTALVGTVDLGAARWGEYFIPLAQDIAAGKPVPTEVYAPVVMLPAELP